MSKRRSLCYRTFTLPCSSWNRVGTGGLSKHRRGQPEVTRGFLEIVSFEIDALHHRVAPFECSNLFSFHRGPWKTLRESLRESPRDDGATAFDEELWSVIDLLFPVGFGSSRHAYTFDTGLPTIRSGSPRTPTVIVSDAVDATRPCQEGRTVKMMVELAAEVPGLLNSAENRSW